MDFKDKLAEAAGTVLLDEPMSGHTTFRIGGPADYFAVPQNIEALRKGIALCREEGMPYFIVGNGSNLLVGDGGYRGVIFNICHTLDEEEFEKEADSLRVKAGAGVMLSALARRVCDMGYAGFEYATGIPGTLGGAVTMNAGAYGGEIKDAILWADVMDSEGRQLRLDAKQLKLSYRHSVIMESGYIVLGAAFRFPKGERDAILAKSAELGEKRRARQPLEYPSAGSTFKRPEGYYAGKLIQDCGLRGYRIGGAQISEKHTGFVINIGGATARDVQELIRYVQQCVYEKFSVRIEPEVRLIGEFI